jgi:HEAT repeat protein
MPSRISTRIRQLDSLAAIQALGKMGPQEDVVQTLAHHLGHADVLVRIEVVRAIAGMGPLAVSWLVLPLSDSHFAVRREAATGLGKMGQDAVSAVAALAPLLQDEDMHVRVAATLTLGLIGPGAAPAIPALMRVLIGLHLILSRLAAQSLSRVGVAAVPALTQALISADKYARREAAWALGEIGPAVARGYTLDAIEEMSLEVEQPAAVHGCAKESNALVTTDFGKEMAVPEMASGEWVPLPAAPDPLTALTAALHDEDAKVREATRQALMRICGQR